MIRVGDFIREIGNSRWFEVIAADGSSPFISVAAEVTRSLIRHDSVCQLHRQNDPWDFNECQSASTTQGKFGGKGEPPVPTELQYQGTFFVHPWLYSYRNHPGNWKCKVPFEEFVIAAGVSLSGIPASDIKQTLTAIENVSIRGYRAIPRSMPERAYQLSEWVGRFRERE